jgi:hypothetical protein
MKSNIKKHLRYLSEGKNKFTRLNESINEKFKVKVNPIFSINKSVEAYKDIDVIDDINVSYKFNISYDIDFDYQYGEGSNNQYITGVDVKNIKGPSSLNVELSYYVSDDVDNYDTDIEFLTIPIDWNDVLIEKYKGKGMLGIAPNVTFGLHYDKNKGLYFSIEELIVHTI